MLSNSQDQKAPFFAYFISYSGTRFIYWKWWRRNTYVMVIAKNDSWTLERNSDIWVHHLEMVFLNLQWPELEERWQQASLTFFYEIYNNLAIVNKYRSEAGGGSRRTWSYPFQYHHPNAYTDSFKNLFPQGQLGIQSKCTHTTKYPWEKREKNNNNKKKS